MNTCLLLLLFHGVLWSQEDVKILKKKFRTDTEVGFKEAWKSIKEGDRFFREGPGTHDLARDHYLFAHQYNPDNPALNYKIGVCYLNTDDKYEAINYLHRAFELDPEVSSDIHLLLGEAFHMVLDFDNAIEHYNAHKEQLEEDELLAYTDVLTKKLTECQHGRTLSQDPVRVIIQNLGEAVNSRFDDYNPVFAYEDTALFFTSRRPVEKSERNPIDNKFNEDIYRAAVTGDEFEEAVRLDKPFNTSHNDALVDISPEGNLMFIYRGHIDGGDVLASFLKPEKMKWSSPRKLARKLRSKQSETSVCLAPGGEELFFVSADEDLTKGGKDILVSRLDENGRWSEPRNLGGVINTRYDEEGVFISPDGKYLYFASQGHNSMGGFDVFRSLRQENGAWSAPENLGYPINTPDDELFFITGQAGIYGYYSANREGGIGARDIYKVIFLGSEKELITATVEQLVAGPPAGKTGFLTRPVLMQLDTTLVVTGRVLDTIGGVAPVLARLSFIDPDDGSRGYDVITNDRGEYTARLPEPKVYGVEINATGYLYFLDIVDLLGETGDERIERDFFLKKLEVGTKVVLENIYFETGKAVLRPESFDALDQVYRFLENNPGIKLEISGHTDNTGTLRINQRLSRERAKAVVDYLTGRGISADALVYEGYADTQPIAPNDTAAGREKNRRVEFKVISK